MTANQINYQNYLETGRHNLETERQGRVGLSETKRHNKVVETETSRHNKRTEKQTDKSLRIQNRAQKETVRHNKATEKNEAGKLQLGWSTLGETTRHNKATEAISGKQAEASMISAQAAKTNASYAGANSRSQRINAKANKTNATVNEFLSYPNRDLINAKASNEESKSLESSAKYRYYNKQSDKYDDLVQSQMYKNNTEGTFRIIGGITGLAGMF